MLPSLGTYLKLIKGSLTNFIDYVYKQRNPYEDKQKYSSLDRRPRGIVKITTKVLSPSATTISRTQIEMKEQYLHLYLTSQEMKNYKDTKAHQDLLNELA